MDDDNKVDENEIFDRALVRRRRARAAERFSEADFLLAEATDGIVGRLTTVLRTFPLAVELGGQDARLREALLAEGKAEHVVWAEEVPDLLAGARPPALACDLEALPFAPESLDLAVSALSLQWVNDLPGTLLQLRRALKPDGLFLAALAGGETLNELRQAMLDAEVEVAGGASPRVAPFVEVREMGGLLQRAGFALPVADSDAIVARYGSLFDLLLDLRRMGWTSALARRTRAPLRRRVLMRAAELYAERHSDPDGRVRATFEIVYAAGWAPHESQQKPLRPGSAQTRLADALGVPELPAGDKTPRRR